MADPTIDVLARERVADSYGMLARAFRDSPSNVSMYGTDPYHRLEACIGGFAAIMPWYEAPAIVARLGDVALGAAGRGREHRCLARFIDTLRAPLEAADGEEGERIRTWLFAWADHDPAEPHWHLGPIGVEPAFQGMRIGSAMLERFCADVDRDGVIAWLETDKPQNVRLYERFGFEVVEEIDILGVHNWWMRRPSC